MRSSLCSRPAPYVQVLENSPEGSWLDGAVHFHHHHQPGFVSQWVFCGLFLDTLTKLGSRKTALDPAQAGTLSHCLLRSRRWWMTGAHQAQSPALLHALTRQSWLPGAGSPSHMIVMVVVECEC